MIWFMQSLSQQSVMAHLHSMYSVERRIPSLWFYYIDNNSVCLFDNRRLHM